MEGDHSGDHIAKVIYQIIDDAGLKNRVRLPLSHSRKSALTLIKKIGLITCDNASNNNTMFESLERLLIAKGIPFDSEGNHGR